jgi:hypothetical protein
MAHGRAATRDDSDWDVAVFLKGEPTSTDRRILSDIDFNLMMESGQHVQAIAIDHEQSAEQSYFVTNVLKDGLVA